MEDEDSGLIALQNLSLFKADSFESDLSLYLHAFLLQFL
jgi:hypothetical protein